MANIDRSHDRRSICQEHTATMKEIFEQVDKRLPVWVFIASISILGSIFGFITYVSNRSMDGVHSRISSHIEKADKNMDKISDAMKEINNTLVKMQVNQAVNTNNIGEIAKDLEEIKKIGNGSSTRRTVR